jgi:hypothetical protein
MRRRLELMPKGDFDRRKESREDAKAPSEMFMISFAPWRFCLPAFLKPVTQA